MYIRDRILIHSLLRDQTRHSILLIIFISYPKIQLQWHLTASMLLQPLLIPDLFLVH